MVTFYLPSLASFFFLPAAGICFPRPKREGGALTSPYSFACFTDLTILMRQYEVCSHPLGRTFTHSIAFPWFDGSNWLLACIYFPAHTIPFIQSTRTGVTCYSVNNSSVSRLIIIFMHPSWVKRAKFYENEEGMRGSPTRGSARVEGRGSNLQGPHERLGKVYWEGLALYLRSH